ARGDVSRSRRPAARDRCARRAGLRLAGGRRALPTRARPSDPRRRVPRAGRRARGVGAPGDRAGHGGGPGGGPRRPRGVAVDARSLEDAARGRGSVVRRLVIAPNWIGDAVMSLPFLRALRRADPAGVLAVLARKGPAAIYRAEGSATEVLPRS